MKISIRERPLRGERVRWLLAGGTIESAAYLEKDRRNELVFPYLRQLAAAFGMRPGIRNTLLLGGGGFAYPRYYVSHYPERRMDVAEISPGMIRISRKLFFLDDLIRENGMSPREVFVPRGAGGSPGMRRDGSAPRLRVFCEDAFDYLLRCPERYDFIIDDAYTGRRAVGGLRSGDGIRLIRARLSAGGIYAVNVVSAMRGPLSLKKRKEERLLRKTFRYTASVPCDDTAGYLIPQNILMFASDEAL